MVSIGIDKNNSELLFKMPPSQFRGAPFWAWNSELDPETLIRQIEVFKEMGLGGFHMHCRSGLRLEYLSDEFMELIKLCNEKAKELGLFCYLYDEDRWPSGAAGGFVTKDKSYRLRFLTLTPENYTAETQDSPYGRYRKSNDRTLVARYSIVLENGFLKNYKTLKDGEDAEEGSTVWKAEIVVSDDSPWFNNQAYVDVLNKKAIDKFIEITHERYYGVVGGDFGKSVPAIFTDEPLIAHKETLRFANELRPVSNPFTDDFDKTFKETYGISILEHFPEVIWELPNGEVSKIRYMYHDHVCERFAKAFSDNIGAWCKSRNLKFTGHMMAEDTLTSQTVYSGEVMRILRSFEIPGIDMLCDKYEFTTAKQAQSVSRQYNRNAVMSELYGVTNWDFDFRGHKTQGDWQAALGVTLRVHHLTWVSMNGEAKRDYPACIGEQSPWYKEYSYIENHFARLNTALTSGKSIVKVGVIHPVESAWLYYGTNENTAEIRREMDENFIKMTEWLVYGLIDFDFISESLLPDISQENASCPIKVGEMEYSAIIVPNCVTLRSTTLKRLINFKKVGGKVIFTGMIPQYIDAEKSDKAEQFALECETVSFVQTKILHSLEAYRDVDVENYDKTRADGMAYQLRDDGSCKWLFVCNAKKHPNKDIPRGRRLSVSVKGEHAATIYDTITGDIKPVLSRIENGRTYIEHIFYEHDSLLLKLEFAAEIKQMQSANIAAPAYLGERRRRNATKQIMLNTPSSFNLSEPNCALLNVCEFAFDDGDWQPTEEILRIDNLFRRKLELPLRTDSLAQPWARKSKDTGKHTLKLRFTVNSEIDIDGCRIALENSENTAIFFNGGAASAKPDGFFTDRCIKTIPLPAIKAGRNEIVLEIDYNDYSDVEWCYLLGNFGVNLAGKNYTLTKPASTVSFGDYTRQGLPFYAGNITYNSEVDIAQTGRYLLRVTHFRTPLLKVAVDGIEKGIIALSPYTLELGDLSAGKHTVSITSYGNRINAFGAVHNSDPMMLWVGPAAWRSDGITFSYEYQLRPSGILTSPILQLIED